MASTVTNSLRTGLAGWSDAQLLAAASETLSTPRAEIADSFVLHAPLELAARAALLPFVRPEARAGARLRVVELAEGFEAFGPPIASRVPVEFADVEDAARRFVAAHAAGDLDGVDDAAEFLGRAASPAELARLLTPSVLRSLAAAAHAPIFLYQLPRVAPRGELGGRLLRGLARELTRFPAWRIEWLDGDRADDEATVDAFADRVRRAPALGAPGSVFIYPVMHQVDGNGVAAELLADVVGGDDIGARGRELLRIAARSMVTEPPEPAPPGWSHCLTTPQAVLGIAPSGPQPADALAVAATFVVGFRASMAANALPDAYAPDDPGVDVFDAFGAEPATAAAAVHHAPPEQLEQVVYELATRASLHHDAHLVKYTLACFDAAAADPEARRLFLAAAASLVAYWQA
jgi:hypothetical protein